MAPSKINFKVIVSELVKKHTVFNTLIIICISFFHFVVSFLLNSIPHIQMNSNDIKAEWQPPAIVLKLSIVWPILYLLLGIIGLNGFYSKKFAFDLRIKIIKNTIIEALGQGLWLISFGKYITSNKTYNRFIWQYYMSTIIIILLVFFAWKIRIPNLKKSSKILLFIYLPYALWISFASILNVQILYKLVL